MLILSYDGLLRRPYQDGTAEEVSALIKEEGVDDDGDDNDNDDDDDDDDDAYEKCAGTGVTIYVVDHGYYTRNSEYTRMAVPPRWIFAGSQSQKQVREDLHRHGHGSCVGSKVNGPKYGTAKNVNLVIVKAATVAWETDDAPRKVLEDVKRRKLQGKAVIILERGRHDEAASEELKKLTKELIRNDVVIFTSSGNDFRDAVERGLIPAREINHWPALMAGQGVPIINVGAVDNTGKNASFSQGGPLVHVMAPGVGVRCASNSFFFRSQRMDGTSFASPAVAGLSAYLLALGEHPELRQTGRVAANVKKLLIEMSYRRSTGGGLVVYNGQADARSRFRGAKGSQSRLGKKALSLDQFLQRSRVISLYREIIRGTGRIADPNTRAESRRFVRDEFERHRDVTDLGHIRYLISTGKTEWQGMERYVEG
ncbi:Subtilisin-like protease 2, partial [Colletotrichum shisoi]